MSGFFLTPSGVSGIYTYLLKRTHTGSTFLKEGLWPVQYRRWLGMLWRFYSTWAVAQGTSSQTIFWPVVQVISRRREARATFGHR